MENLTFEVASILTDFSKKLQENSCHNMQYDLGKRHRRSQY